MHVLPEIAARPQLRGVSHQWAFLLALTGGALLVAFAPDGRARIALTVYAITIAGLFGCSALYHRTSWSSARTLAWARRLDHSMIFLVIAGTYTPFAVLVLQGTMATVILIIVWAGALAGVLLKLVWIGAPRWLAAAAYVALGWVAIAAFPQLIEHAGTWATIGLAGGGVLYTLGAVVYALQRPDPIPTVFGYHEVFHALVIAAAALQFAVVAAVSL